MDEFIRDFRPDGPNDDRRWLESLIEKTGDISYPALYAMLTRNANDEYHIRQVLIIIINLYVPPQNLSDFVAPITTLLGHKSGDIRGVAARALGKIGTPSDLQSIYILLYDSELLIKFSALRTLAEYGNAQTLSAIDLWIRFLPVDICVHFDKFLTYRNQLATRLGKDLR